MISNKYSATSPRVGLRYRNGGCIYSDMVGDGRTQCDLTSVSGCNCDIGDCYESSVSPITIVILLLCISTLFRHYDTATSKVSVKPALVALAKDWELAAWFLQYLFQGKLCYEVVTKPVELPPRLSKASNKSPVVFVHTIFDSDLNFC